MILPKSLKICWQCGKEVFPWINIPTHNGRLITYRCSHCFAEHRRLFKNDDEILAEAAADMIEDILEQT